MELMCLGSSSKGNCYVFKASDGVLLLECGIAPMEIKKALRWRLDSISGCLVTHEHRDHSKHISDIQKAGIPIYALPEVFNSHSLKTKVMCRPIKPLHGYKIGSFKVFTLPVDHDVPCLAFVIEHQEMGKLLFVTDTMMLRYRVENLNHIMIEANYCDDILQHNIDNGYMPASMRPRLLQSHMELKTAIEALLSTDLSSVNEIILLHLSDVNSDGYKIKKTVAETTGKPAYIAQPGFGISLTKTPY